jgi:hypothetical protein
MAESKVSIPLEMANEEADAFARFLKRCTYHDCVARSNHLRRYPDGREEVDVMWSALRAVEHQFGAAGFAPR